MPSALANHTAFAPLQGKFGAPVSHIGFKSLSEAVWSSTLPLDEKVMIFLLSYLQTLCQPHSFTSCSSPARSIFPVIQIYASSWTIYNDIRDYLPPLSCPITNFTINGCLYSTCPNSLISANAVLCVWSNAAS